MCLPTTDRGKAGWAFFFLVLLGAIIAGTPIGFYCASGLDGRTITVVWLAGAGALGLLSGFTTGASKQQGTAGELLKFLSAGIIVPLLGGIAAIVRQPQQTIERSTYVGEHVTEKITEIVLKPEIAYLYPLAILGGFFVTYGVFATLAIILGVVLRDKAQIFINLK